MRVLLVANFEPDGLESMLRHAEWLSRALTARGHEVIVTRPQPAFAKLAKYTGASKYLGYLDKFVLFPPKLRRLARSHDLVHILDHSNSMYLKAVRDRPNLITCHDVLAIRSARGEFAESPTGWSGKLLQRWILNGLCKARNVVCVSAKTAEDLRRLTQNRVDTVQIIANPLNWSYEPCATMPQELFARLGLGADRPYFIHVGANQWYKNRIGVLRMFAEMAGREQFSNAKLVMVGKPWTPAMRAFVIENKLEDRVIEAVRLPNTDLQALYSHAQALIFPSLQEGFGYPILEAQACGCPVVTIGRPPMSEVAGDAAILIDPSKPAQAAEIIAKGLQHREDLRAAGFRNITRFEEAKTLDKYCALYRSIVASQVAYSPFSQP